MFEAKFDRGSGMIQIFQENSAVARFIAFVLVFAAVALAEWSWPRRKFANSRIVRWYSNLGILGIDSLAGC